MRSRWTRWPSSVGQAPLKSREASRLRLMGYLHRKSKDKKGDSLIHDVFQGEVQVRNSSDLKRRLLR